jgi:hypothetical protein
LESVNRFDEIKDLIHQIYNNGKGKVLFPVSIEFIKGYNRCFISFSTREETELFMEFCKKDKSRKGKRSTYVG